MNTRGDGEAWAWLTTVDYDHRDLRQLARSRLYGEPAGGATPRCGDGGTELHVHARIMTGGSG
jgi:hypothetical protein